MAAPKAAVTATFDMSGPFFRVDPGKTMLENVHTMMTGIAAEGAKMAGQNLMIGSGRRALVRSTDDRVADHVIGRTHSISGAEWLTAAVVQVSKEGLSREQATSLMAAGSYVEGRTHGVRKATTQIRRARAVLNANLTKGME